eukprot:8058641-Lingulodinium_polyedra.AAC.1
MGPLRELLGGGRQAVAESYSAIAGVDCPLLHGLLPRIVSERQEEHRTWDATWPKEVLDHLWQSRVVVVKGPPR